MAGIALNPSRCCCETDHCGVLCSTACGSKYVIGIDSFAISGLHLLHTGGIPDTECTESSSLIHVNASGGHGYYSPNCKCWFSVAHLVFYHLNIGFFFDSCGTLFYAGFGDDGHGNIIPFAIPPYGGLRGGPSPETTCTDDGATITFTMTGDEYFYYYNPLTIGVPCCPARFDTLSYVIKFENAGEYDCCSPVSVPKRDLHVTAFSPAVGAPGYTVTLPYSAPNTWSNTCQAFTPENGNTGWFHEILSCSDGNLDFSHVIHSLNCGLPGAMDTTNAHSPYHDLTIQNYSASPFHIELFNFVYNQLWYAIDE